jgi:hypothetical protein
MAEGRQTMTTTRQHRRTASCGARPKAPAAWLPRIRRFLAGFRLSLHPRKCVVVPVRAGVPFLGWRVFPDHRLLRRSTGVRFQRRLKELTSDYAAGRIGLEAVKASLASWIGHLKHGDTWGLRRRLLEAAVFRTGRAEGTL